MFEETFPSAPAHRVSRSALGWRLAGGFGLAGEREKSAKIALNPQLRFGARNRRVASPRTSVDVAGIEISPWGSVKEIQKKIKDLFGPYFRLHICLNGVMSILSKRG